MPFAKVAANSRSSCLYSAPINAVSGSPDPFSGPSSADSTPIGPSAGQIAAISASFGPPSGQVSSIPYFHPSLGRVSNPRDPSSGQISATLVPGGTSGQTSAPGGPAVQITGPCGPSPDQISASSTVPFDPSSASDSAQSPPPSGDSGINAIDAAAGIHSDPDHLYANPHRDFTAIQFNRTLLNIKETIGQGEYGTYAGTSSHACSPAFCSPRFFLCRAVCLSVSLSFCLLSFWAADPKGTMSYRTEG